MPTPPECWQNDRLERKTETRRDFSQSNEFCFCGEAKQVGDERQIKFRAIQQDLDTCVWIGWNVTDWALNLEMQSRKPERGGL